PISSASRAGSATVRCAPWSLTGSDGEPHVSPDRHRTGAVPHAVRALRGLSAGDARRCAASGRMEPAENCAAGDRLVRADARQLPGAGAIFRCAARLDLRAGARAGRQIRPRTDDGRDEVTDAGTLDHAPWLDDGALRQLLALLDRDGEEARVVGGA